MKEIGSKENSPLKKDNKSCCKKTMSLTFLLSFFWLGKKMIKKVLEKNIKQNDLLLLEVEKENNPEILSELKKELVKEKIKIQESNSKNKDNIKDIQKIEKTEKIIENKLNSLKIELQANQENNDILEEEKTQVTKKIAKDPEILEFLTYMKLEINTIELKMKEDLNIFQLKYLKSRIIKLNDKRENFKDNYNFNSINEIYKTKDKYNILVNNITLDELYKKCENKINDLNQEEVSKKTKKRIKQIDLNLEEVKNINEFLNKDIKKQQTQVSKSKKLLAKTDKKLKKETLLNISKTMLIDSMKISKEHSKTTLFKDKLVKGLINAFVLNNSIRSIRNLMNEEKIEYALLLSNINNYKDCIFHTRLVYEDCVTQIEFLKYDLIAKFNFSNLKDIFNKIYEIEEQIKNKNKLLSDLENELEVVYDKNRKK